MGLAGRKQKQRIPADPRNLSWADDASRFGHAYLSKFGWDASQGLGSSGDGIKTHLKVQQKLDMMGIGSQHQRDPNGIAWKQNRDFEALLKRLNESTDADGEEREMGFVSAQKDESSVGKKRKHKETDASEKPKKKHSKSGSDIPAVPPSSPNPHSEPIPKPRPMAHRARVRAAKRIVGKSASAISEILGVGPSSSTSSPAHIPLSTPTPLDPPSSLSLNNITISAKSVADYFKEKLLARSTASSAPPSSSPSGLATPALVTSTSNIFSPNDEVEPPRRGIGHRAPVVPSLPIPGDGGGDLGGQDTLTEKMRRKAERRKRREIEATTQSITEEADEEGESPGRTSKKERKIKKHRERGQQALASEQSSANDDNLAVKKNHEHEDTRSKKPKKEHKKKRPL